LNCSAVIGIERGEETKRVHLQGYVECHVHGRNGIKVSRFTVLESGHDCWWFGRKGSRLQAATYCTKEGDYEIVGSAIEELLDESDNGKYVKEIEVMYDWQKEITALLLEAPDERTIYWYFEPEGCTGKTTFGKWMYTHPEDVGGNVLILSGKADNMKHGIINYKEEFKCLPRTVIMNVPRTNLRFLSYTGIEEVKDMFFHSGKYEGGHVCGPEPHLIVFANEPPEAGRVSIDRWKIREIKDNTATAWTFPETTEVILLQNWMEMRDKYDNSSYDS